MSATPGTRLSLRRKKGSRRRYFTRHSRGDALFFVWRARGGVVDAVDCLVGADAVRHRVEAGVLGRLAGVLAELDVVVGELGGADDE